MTRISENTLSINYLSIKDHWDGPSTILVPHGLELEGLVVDRGGMMGYS
jgi:hypothetical protein